ncbi:MAG: hypothetical protein AAF532_17275 [Planctomycetota bacterium]
MRSLVVNAAVALAVAVITAVVTLHVVPAEQVAEKFMALVEGQASMRAEFEAHKTAVAERFDRLERKIDDALCVVSVAGGEGTP